MDDSQSDVFSESSIDMDQKSLDMNTYKTTFSRIKEILGNKHLISVHLFNDVLQECDLCIHQCLDSIVHVIDSKLEYQVLVNHIEDAVCLLGMLSSFIKRVLESIALACSNMETYPTITGNIILSVFSHCKDSNCLYGDYLKKVETQLKDLFRTCHELQLTYLMTMEKHFTFDLSESDQLNVLLEALDINLKIVEVVQALDIKTMAELWKAYTVMCKKYSRHLLDTHIYNRCSKVLIEMIRSNTKNSLETPDQDNEAALRSIKIAGFGIKILSIICQVFKNTPSFDYEDISDLLIYLYIFNPSYLESNGKSIELANLVETNVTVSLDALLVQLVKEQEFIRCICNVDENKIQGDAYLGYSLLLTTVMKIILGIAEELPNDIRIPIIKKVFWLLPKGHTWFNMGLKFQTSKQTSVPYCTLFELVLTVTAAFAMTLNCQEYKRLECIIYECLLSSDCYCGLFAGSLLVLLLRSGDQKLLANSLLSLLKVYRKLCSKNVFHSSPQKLYLSFTLRNLFRYCTNQDKLLIFKEYDIQEMNNADVWIALGISNLPNNVRSNAEALVLQKLSKMIQQHGTNEEYEILIKLMQLAVSCNKNNNEIIDLISKMVDNMCPKCNFEPTESNITIDTLFYNYIEALVKLIESEKDFISKEVKIKIVNLIASILKSGNTDLLFILFRPFCEMYEEVQSKSDLHDVVEKYLINNDTQGHTYIYFCALSNSHVFSELSLIPSVSAGLKEFLRNLKDKGVLKKQLEFAAENKFVHKCLKVQGSTLSSGSKPKSNFDLADINSFFDNESDCEPASKKVKLTDKEIEDLITKLEDHAAPLIDVKENVLKNEHRSRISDICVKLQNILEK